MGSNPIVGFTDLCLCVDAGGRDLCKDRLTRYQEREFNGTKINGGKSNVTAGAGRATVTHHHGMASTSSMDGWAEQFFCNGESKVLLHPLTCGLYVWLCCCFVVVQAPASFSSQPCR